MEGDGGISYTTQVYKRQESGAVPNTKIIEAMPRVSFLNTQISIRGEGGGEVSYNPRRLL